jgi:zinc transport system substrate-binding protein
MASGRIASSPYKKGDPHMKHVGITILIFLLVFCASGTSLAAEKLSAFVSILPQKYFVEKIGGSLTAVSVMVDPGGNPHNYEPKPRQMAELSKAGIYFAAGVQFEDVWLKRFAALNPDMLVIHTEEGIEKLPMRAYSHHEGGETGSHEAEHSHGTKDPHIWLSPPLVKIQAENILKGLAKADPNHQADYEANYKALI